MFVLGIADHTGPMLAGWLEAGHHIHTVVVPGFRKGQKRFSIGNFRRRLQRRLLLKRYVGNTPVRLIEFGRPYDWASLGKKLSGSKADVLICYALPALIPQPLLDHFPNGGLNLHPALLPHYRGPHPVHCLVADGQQERYGGMTLHKMSAAFDEGDILAQVPFGRADWDSIRDLTDATATAMGMLVREAVPAYCEGRLAGLRQPSGEFGWARLTSDQVVLSARLSIAHVERMWRVLGHRPGIYVDLGGQPVRTAFHIRRLGPPSGKAPVKRWATVEFDLADGRVVHLVYSRLLKRIRNIRWPFARKPGRVTPLEMRLFGAVEGTARQP